MSEQSVQQFPASSTIIIGVAVVVGTYFLLRRNPRIKKELDKFNGPPTVPFLGNALSFLGLPREDYIHLFDKWIQLYQPIMRFWMGNFISYIGIVDLNIVEKVMANHIDKSKYDYNLFHDWLGTGLLTAPRNKWSVRRKLLTPTFHFKILEDFLPVFNEQSSVLVKCLKKECDTGERFNIYPYITHCALDVICETAMGKKIDAQTSSANKSYIDAVYGMSDIIVTKITHPWLRIPLVYWLSSISTAEKKYLRSLKGFTESVIEARKIERLKSRQKVAAVKMAKEDPNNESTMFGKQRKAFLDLLLDTSESGVILDNEGIREEVDTFMFEGHDTTSANLAWTVLLLSVHPECQKKVQEELDEIFADDPTRDVTTADIAKMKYLECCVKESLRLFPSVPLIMRNIDSDIRLDDGRVIPEGVTGLIPIYYIHRDPKNYPDPNEFKPERFTLENCAGRHPYAYIPFSAASRNCIGQKFALIEEKVILAKLFRAYEFGAGQKLEEAQPVPDVILRSKNGIHVKVLSRKA